jgi:hypothetical protein
MQEVQFVAGYPTSREERLQSFSTVQRNASRLRWRKVKLAIKPQPFSSKTLRPKRRRKDQNLARQHNAARSVSEKVRCGGEIGYAALENPEFTFTPTLDSRRLPPVLPVQCTDLVQHSDLHFILHTCQLALFSAQVAMTSLVR